MLDDAHRGAEDYTLVVPAELLAEQQRTQRIFEIVMVAIAAISLLVGGIGIMNIMLASVLERTREIGVRRAVGAHARDILCQFLFETTLIAVRRRRRSASSLGVGDVAADRAASPAGRRWSPVSIVLAFSVSVVIGLVFGVYPARKAATPRPGRSPALRVRSPALRISVPARLPAYVPARVRWTRGGIGRESALLPDYGR